MKEKDLLIIKRIVSSVMLLSLGFMLGGGQQDSYLNSGALLLVFIGACSKMWIEHRMKKLKKAEDSLIK